jgi:aryl-alcohol dehydrogenase-like predicted oxidoreductase
MNTARSTNQQERRILETLPIADTGRRATRICLGTWAIGGWMWGGTEEKQSIATIRAAIDRGINAIDTAPTYGFGQSEDIVGKAVEESGRRADLVISTKVGIDWPNRSPVRDARPERIRKEILDSLRRLRTSYIDVYQVHWPDPEVPIEQTARAMLELYEAGKIRAIGTSNFSVEQMQRFRAVAPIHVTQSPYNLFEREIERDVLPYAERNGITTFAYGALCRGLLTGKITKDTRFTGDDLRKLDPKFQGERFEQYLAAVGELARFARERFGKSVLALAVRWILDRGHTVALWGARQPGQLDPVDDVMGWKIDAPAMAEIDRILARTITRPVGPEFMAPPARNATTTSPVPP